MSDDLDHTGCHIEEEELASTLRMSMQHVLNPLHVYCRLRELGVSGQTAQSVCGVYERLYRRVGGRDDADV